MAHIEKEAKLTLSQVDYYRLREDCRVLECRDQLNIYLHDPHRLHEGLGYFRVRFERNERGEVIRIIGMYDDGSTDTHDRSR